MYLFYYLFIAGGKTSACYVDDKGNGIPIGSTQIGPFSVGNSILLSYAGKPKLGTYFILDLIMCS